MKTPEQLYQDCYDKWYNTYSNNFPQPFELSIYNEMMDRIGECYEINLAAYYPPTGTEIDNDYLSFSDWFSNFWNNISSWFTSRKDDPEYLSATDWWNETFSDTNGNDIVSKIKDIFLDISTAPADLTIDVIWEIIKDNWFVIIIILFIFRFIMKGLYYSPIKLNI